MALSLLLIGKFIKIPFVCVFVFGNFCSSRFPYGFSNALYCRCSSTISPLLQYNSAEKNIGKGDIYSWPVGVQTCTNTVETSVAVPQEAGNLYRSNYITLDNNPK